jgi:hypothetical protein
LPKIQHADSVSAFAFLARMQFAFGIRQRARTQRENIAALTSEANSIAA